MSQLAVEIRQLRKAFGSCVANASVDLRVEPGTIHGIVGENGAGKSTAMKMLYGMYRPDSGDILLDGVKRDWNSPQDAIAAGIGMVHQHFMLAGPYTVLDNILLGAEPSRKGVLSVLPRAFRPVMRGEGRRRLQKLASQYGLPAPWDSRIESLPVGIQQRVEILKLLYRDAQILILDEPTAVLTPQEIVDLFKQLKRLRDEGKTVLIITHKLKEVMDLTDKVTVFRAGTVVGERVTSQSSAQELADLMVGRKVNLTVDPPAPVKLTKREETLRLENVNLDVREGRSLSGIEFSVMTGEIVGIAGVEGNGQTELLDVLIHPRDYAGNLGALSGRINILGKEVNDLEARDIRGLGIGVVPADRHKEGLMLDRSVEDNFLLGHHRWVRFQRGGFLDATAVRKAALQAIEEYDVRPRSLKIDAGGLSGGNQQKLVIGREFQTKPKFLIAAQPTRGVDVGAIEMIHQRILKARGEGVGVLLVSSELDEVLALSDRVLVMFEGRIVGEFSRGTNGRFDHGAIGLAMGGARK